MKKLILVIAVVFSGLISFGQSQPNNLDIGLSANGTNGSNGSSGAYVAVSLKALNGVYTAVPAAEDFGIILRAPKSDFSISDNLVAVQHNTSLYGGTVMTPQTPIDIGDQYLYYQVVLGTGSGLNLSSLTVGNWSFAFTFNFSTAKTPTQFNKLVIIDQTNDDDLSAAFGGADVFSVLLMQGANQLTNAAFTTLPATLLNFSGYKNGIKNSLRWTTASENNNMGFEVQRSIDGVNFSAIGFVNSKALNGNSSANISYTFDDNSPVSRKQYYRLLQKDLDGRTKQSNTISISGDKPLTLGIGGLFPNPAKTQVSVIIDAPGREDVTLMITDLSGKTVKQQIVSVEIGSNTVPVDISNLAQGSYFVKAVCKSSDCGMAVGKFNKQ